MARLIMSAFADECSRDVREQVRVLHKTGISHLEPRFIGEKNIGSTGRDEVGPPNSYMNGNIVIGGEFDYERIGTIGENNVSYDDKENTLFVNPTLGDYRFVDGAGFYDIPYEKIGRY